MSNRVERLGAALTLGAVLAVCGGAGVAAAGVGAHTSARLTHTAAHQRPHKAVRHDDRASRDYATALNVALTGTATASTEASGSPASRAIDGDASTQWCSTQWTGNVTVDLGSVRTLNGFGLTLGDTATTALTNISAGTDPNSLQPVSALQQQTPPAGKPVYWPLHGTVRARYVKIDVTDNDGTPPCIGEFRAFSATPSSVLPFRGADLSFEPQEEAAGAHFTDGGVPGSALSILNHHGLNYVRLRLWVNPPAGYSDLGSDLKMAQRLKAAGDKLYLDIHYSDFWADPQHQDIPAAWHGQDLSQLTASVQSYTRSVLHAFAAQGTPVDMVSIGNEIRNGMLWPVGQVNWTADTGWSNLVTLLKAGVAGAHEGNPAGHKLLVMLHFDEGGNNADSVRFYDHMVQGGVPFDVIGLSYYPFFHGQLNAMRANVDDLATRYGKSIVIAESQYPWTLAAGDSTGNFVWQTSQLSGGYPASPGGQESFYNDALSILAQVPAHRALGLFYWEPEWIPGVGWEPGAGTPNDNLTLFSFTGKALPSVGLFQSPLAVCRHFDPWYTGDCEI
jgi:arabinogalactan endo-1,4-beta-galactosidase